MGQNSVFLVGSAKMYIEVMPVEMVAGVRTYYRTVYTNVCMRRSCQQLFKIQRVSINLYFGSINLLILLPTWLYVRRAGGVVRQTSQT